ncbi:MAG: acyl-CoA dehydrogenase family protein [Pseudomonadota bacterium]|nr:acyl-CoA dehydrogenase family protein [Pseudomonadota bacterium]
MAFEPVLTAAETALIEAAAELARTDIGPNAAQREKERGGLASLRRKAGAAGILGLLAPVGAGGGGCSFSGAARVFEEMARSDMASTFGMIVHANLVANIARTGNPRQQAEFLPGMLAGERTGAFLLTEPGTGSDAQAIACRATEVPGGWRIDGEKAWISNAADADVLSVYVQSDPAGGWRGIMAFLVEADRPGIERLGPWDLHGGHALGTGGFRFDGLRVSPDDILLPREAAFRGAMGGINSARVFVGAMCTGMMRDALDRALAYTAERTAFGQPLAAFQGLEWMLADAATDIEATRLLTWAAAARMDAGEDATLAAAHAKKYAARAACRAIGDCMQVLGANGFRQDQPVARHLANARMAHFIDGTTEIQNVVIGRALRSPARR